MAAGSINESIARNRSALKAQMAVLEIDGIRHVEFVPPGKSREEILEGIRSGREQKIKQARAFKQERDNKPDSRVAVHVIEDRLQAQGRTVVKRKGWPKGKPRKQVQPQHQEIA